MPALKLIKLFDKDLMWWITFAQSVDISSLENVLLALQASRLTFL